MLIIALAAVQMGFGYALPQQGPLASYRECVLHQLTQSPTQDLRSRAALRALGNACGDMRRRGLPHAVAASIERARATGAPLPAGDYEHMVNLVLDLAVLRALDDELRRRGVNIEPTIQLPPIPRPTR